MSILWIRPVLIDSVPSILEIQLGNKSIGDTCCIRINNEREEHFCTLSRYRHVVLQQGIQLLQLKLIRSFVLNTDRSNFEWI